MAGEFMVCIDKLMGSEACFESENGGAGFGGAGLGAAALADGGAVMEGCSESKQWSSEGKKKKKKKEVGGGVVKECRICQEEGEEMDMEAPCACNGTLKFAHRKCIQRWCNKKGNITCEICNQVFSPNYTVPPSRPSSNAMAIDIRQSWGTLIDLRDPHLLAIAAAQQDLLNAECEDFTVANASGLACCRVITLTLMLLLLLRHVFIVIRNIDMVQDISALFYVSLEFIGFFLPCYVIARSCYLIPNWRRQRVNYVL
ncbi:hypothetical protein Cni_G12385 [Canna indica]|uniref:RING-CH-type domain-containing protein n=1 Tax=Canna indica TaxID=4628 RepID=A0AAQ3K9P2_9LILI|nr:hypothetical protein Cni_G12385 [Canna indica]